MKPEFFWHYDAVNKDKILLPEDRKLILLHCDVGIKAPLSFTVLSRQLYMGSSRETSRRYIEAVEKVRNAIPGSQLAFWVASYD